MKVSEFDRKQIQNCIRQYAEQGMFNGRNTAIFGCTLYAREIRDCLRQYGTEIDVILDNNRDKAGKTCLGVPVCLPEEYFQQQLKEVVVVICSKYSREMRAQLDTLGDKRKQILDIPVEESIRKIEDSWENLQERIHEAEAGYQIYDQIKTQYPKDSVLFLCPYSGTGDIYMACLYLKAYLEKEKIIHYVVVVSAESCRKTAELFKVQNLELVNGENMQLMLKAWECFGSETMQVKPLLYWGWRTKRYLYADSYPQITFNEMFVYDVFGFNDNVEKNFPSIDRKSDYAEKLFRHSALKPHKTVIMAPYAGSFDSVMGMDAWEDLANKLKKRGWTVATNCCGEKELPVRGTVPVYFPYKEAVNVLQYAGGLIALRSGFCDIVSQAKCKLIILYESGFSASRYEYFSLKKMGLNQDVVEFVYEKRKEEEIKQKIVEAMG